MDMLQGGALAIITVVVVLGFMILVHEWGHFIAARLCGVRVDVFSIGFGPRIWGRKRGDTDYRLSALPLGGYVKMAGDNPIEERSGAPDEFLSRPRWQRAIIALAGPVMNLVVAVLLLAGIFVVKGVPYSEFLTNPPEISALPSGSPAANAGLQPGDRIVEVGGFAVATWEQAFNQLEKVTPGSPVGLRVDRNGEQAQVSVETSSPHVAFASLGYPHVRPQLESVALGTPADRAGLKPEDEIVSINGKPVRTWFQLTEWVRGSNGEELQVVARRRGRDLKMAVRPTQATDEEGRTYWAIGVNPQIPEVYRPVSLAGAVQHAAVGCVRITGKILNLVKRLFTGRESLRNMQSVIGISQETAKAARVGPVRFIEVMAIISLNLGILNLLPIPILDGGHLLMLAIEGTIRKDLSLAVKERFVQVGMVFLLVVFAIVMYNDVLRLLPKR